jgi:hypothetical protein
MQNPTMDNSSSTSGAKTAESVLNVKHIDRILLLRQIMAGDLGEIITVAGVAKYFETTEAEAKVASDDLMTYGFLNPKYEAGFSYSYIARCSFL